MAITVQWDNPERNIIRWDFDPVWSWDELADSAKVSMAMIASADEDVDIILNVVGSRAPSGKVSAYQRAAFSYTPSNIRMLVMVCGSEFDAVQVVLPFFEQLHVAEDIDQARTLLLMQTA